MRRTAFAVAAFFAVLISTSAFAAGAFVTRQVQDGSGNHPTQYYDMSGTGIGPFLPVYVCGDGAGNVCATGGSGSSGGGGGGGAVTNAGTFAVQNTAATPACTNTIGTTLPPTGATMTTSQPTITTTATQVRAAGTFVSSEIENLGTANIVIGQTSAVTATTGYIVAPGAARSLSQFTGTVFAIVASGTQPASLISY